MTDTSNKILAVVNAFTKLTGSPYLTPEELAKGKQNEQVPTQTPGQPYRYTPQSTGPVAPDEHKSNK